MHIPLNTWHPFRLGRFRERVCGGAIVLGLMMGVGSIHAETGVTEHRIVVGMSVPITGVNARFGTELEQGVRLGLARANAEGGLAGREFELLVKDDASQAGQAAANTKALAASAFVLTGYHGSAAVEAALPLIESAGIPLIGVASGAEVLREPALRNVFNLRAGARDEAAAIVLQFDTIGLTEIAAIAQDDALGNAAIDGVQFQLMRLAIRPLALVKFEPGASSAARVSEAVRTACKGQPQALVLGLNGTMALTVIREARKIKCLPQFYVMSEAGGELLRSGATPKELAGIIASQVLPYPWSASVPVVTEYQQLAGESASYAGLEGFIYARVIAAASRSCGAQLTRTCMIAKLEAKPVDIGGYRVRFKSGERRGSGFVEMTIITSDGRFRR
ncbi:MAG: ABC transporter substrate-binding protein [Pseudomonadota bacterium]